MDKAPDAFRTISEVAEVLETPAHVLRFWESRFPQIRPVKRAGGRRYYRPGDVALLAGIRHLLHDQGMTIRGVQKVLRESGVRHVQALATGSGLEAAGAEDMEEALILDFLDEAETLPGAGAPPIPSADIVPLPRRAEPGPVERMRAEAPPPANTEEVPEAPFIEAPEEPADPAEVHVLHAAPAAAPPEEAPDEDDAPSDELADELGDEDTTSGLFDDLPLLAALSRVSMAQPPAENEAAPPAEAATDHTAALIAALRDEPAESPRDVTAAEPPTAETPAVAGPDQALAELIGLTLRLRALPRTIEAEAERATALAPVLAQALALQDRLAEARRLDA